MTSLTLSRARAIVGHAENEFASGRRIEDAYSPFADGGASSRTEARNALLLMVAETFRLTTSRASPPQKTRELFEGYSRSSRFIATRIVCDAMRDADEVLVAAMNSGNEYESFLDYIQTLDPKEREFWPKIYERLSLPCPTQPISFFDGLRRHFRK